MKRAELRKITGSLITSLFIVSFVSCKSVDVVGSEDLSRKYEDYMVAELELARAGDLNKAESAFKRVVAGGAAKQGRHGLLRTWLKSGKLQQIVQEKNDFALDDLEMQLIFLVAYFNTGKHEAASTLLAKLRTVYPRNEQVAYYYALSLINGNQPQAALTYLDNFLNSFDNLSAKHSYFYFLKAKVYMQLGKEKQALNSVNRCLEVNTLFGKGWLLKALLSERLGGIEDAIHAYHTYLDLAGEDSNITRKLVTLLFNIGRFQEAEEELKKLSSNSPEYFFDIALIQAKGGKFQEALGNVSKSLLKKPTFSQARILKTEVLLRVNQVREAIMFVADWIESDPGDKTALAMLPALKNAGINQQRLLMMLHGIVDRGIVHKNLLAVLADLCVDARKLKAAFPYLDQILKLTKDELLKSKVFYQKGYTHFVSGEGALAEEALKRAIKMDEVFVPAYNLLAYYYAHAGKNLEAAAMLVDKALVVSSDDPVFLDTKGYIALKQGNKKEAKGFFKKALSVSSDDRIIRRHLQLANR